MCSLKYMYIKKKKNSISPFIDSSDTFMLLKLVKQKEYLILLLSPQFISRKRGPTICTIPP